MELNDNEEAIENWIQKGRGKCDRKLKAESKTFWK